MKKILITGANSYIGTSFEKYIQENYPQDYVVDTVDMLDGAWRQKDFSIYDSVFHVAGIAHQKETKKNANLYYEVNRDLAIETATKAKKDGVKQFIFLSSMSVYGMDTGVITKDTVPTPKSNYGKSKLQAEEGITALRDGNFRVAILRPPMVYGDNCKGNYQMVVKIVELSPMFPRINNQRSMLHIINLASFVKTCIDNHLNGIYFPQNEHYMNTKDMAQEIAIQKGKKLYMSYLLGFAVLMCRPFVGKLKKAFGTLIYVDTEEFGFTYCLTQRGEEVIKTSKEHGK